MVWLAVGRAALQLAPVGGGTLIKVPCCISRERDLSKVLSSHVTELFTGNPLFDFNG